MSDLTGKVALVTGGAQGLGEAICRVLASAGVTVIVADIREELAEKVASEISSEGGKAGALRLDVTDEAQIQSSITKVIEDYEHLDILINNAGIDVTVSIEELDIKDWDRIMAVNLRAPFILSQAVLPHMKQRRSGHIVNIASTASKRTWANATAYHASKWGLVGFSHALHVEARPERVKVTAVIAGGMQTPFILERFPDTPLDKLQDPKNVADTIRYILTQPPETVIPEVMVIPMQESSWP
ncbi:SDR family oxidoreductase [Leptolyngbya sp. NIES-2104]|uniref:SDR family oxidoreductase n=1 Tax=Leptolyngbya sp. NIES-2104 TaxID=1552121 RepID=UPI0006EC4B0C|nr:SDR family oxidoreductase [Leptolyngbya sp. NIES-2104]GAP97667.1 short-chain dehydrogenase/reductase SDR [Leptolyngbya sp. NIES-2104]